jgi:hypothetical protein
VQRPHGTVTGDGDRREHRLAADLQRADLPCRALPPLLVPFQTESRLAVRAQRRSTTMRH